MTAMDPPAHPQQPDPVPGCGVCAALARQRAEATTAGDHSRATDCSVEIRNHPNGHGREGLS